MKKMVLASLLAVVVAATSVPAFAAEAPLEEITIEAEEDVEEVEVVGAEDEEIIEAEDAEVVIEDAEASADAAVLEDGAIAEVSEEVFDVEDYAPEMMAMQAAEDEDMTGMDPVEYLLNGTKVKTPKKLGPVSGFKVGKKFYSPSSGVYEIDLSWKNKRGADGGYVFGFCNDKRAEDNILIRGYTTANTNGYFGSSDISYMTPRTTPYYFRVFGVSTATGLGKKKQSKGVIIPAAGDAAYGTQVHTVLNTKYYFWKGYKYSTDVSITFYNNSDRTITFGGSNRYMRIYDTSSGFPVFKKKLKLKKAYKVKPLKGVTLVYHTKGKVEYPASNCVDFNYGYAGKTFTYRCSIH